MAVSYPLEPRWDDAPPAEHLLWRWVVEELPERVRVLPNVLMTVPEAGRPQEAELDLVLVDPDHGITVVEVKGGPIGYDARHARWLRSGKEVRDPVQQAKRARSVLERALQDAGVATAAVALRWIVATPEAELQAPGSPVLPEHQLWDARARGQLERRLGFVQKQLAMGEEPVGEALADRVVRLLRGRTVTGTASLASAIDRHEESVRVHAASHRAVLNRLSANRHVLVTGAAGTGKTVLAVEATVRAAAYGERVLLGCWNVVLGRWLRATVRQRLEELGSPAAAEVTDVPTGRVVVGDLASIALAGHSVDLAAEQAGSGEDRRRYFYEELPQEFDPSMTDGQFDLVVLDEAQDLSEWWVLCVSQFVPRDGGRWFAFADPDQDLFGTDAALPDFLEVHDELTENFRNTRQIAELVAQFGPIEVDCVAGDGEPVRFVACDTEHVVARVEEVGRKLQRDHGVADGDLALLTLYHNPARLRAADLAADVAAGGLVRTNGAAFKGMERPVVVLGLDVDPQRRTLEDVRRGIYASASRARAHLVVVGDPSVLRAVGLSELAARIEGTADVAPPSTLHVEEDR